MNGEIDFAEALRERVGMLKGLGLDALETTWAAHRLTAGRARTGGDDAGAWRCHRAGLGRLHLFHRRVAALVGFDVHRANTLLDDGAR